MKTKNEHFSDGEKQLFDDIEKYGLHTLFVPGSDYLPSFCYTVGLLKTYGHPEIICFGLSSKAATEVLNNIADIIKSGQKIELKKVYDNFFINVDSQFIEVDQRYIKNYLGYDIWFYETLDIPSLQLVWADRENKFPWEDTFDQELIYRQPLLDRNADFKFRELKNLAVFTTRQFIEGSPILRVVHDAEGDWQFLTGDQMPEDIKIVSLSEIVKSDSAIVDLFDLDYGESAERQSPEHDWERFATEHE